MMVALENAPYGDLEFAERSYRDYWDTDMLLNLRHLFDADRTATAQRTRSLTGQAVMQFVSERIALIDRILNERRVERP